MYGRRAVIRQQRVNSNENVYRIHCYDCHYDHRGLMREKVAIELAKTHACP
jgi:hypothetical protein